MKLKSVRIIAGRDRGRKVLYEEAEGLRPTSDRVRENLFNILQSDIPGAQVLDLFAGTGAFALEALSRGAEFAAIADKSGDCVKNIKRNLAEFKIPPERYNVLHSDYAYALKLLSGKGFDIVYIDPPYDCGFYTECIEGIIDSGVVDADGLIAVESQAGLVLEPPDNAEITGTRVYGTAKLTFIKPKAVD